MTETSIEWTDFSANPLKFRDSDGKIVWGCVKTSPGCANCYSEAIAKRFNRGGPFTIRQQETLTPFLDEKELRLLMTSKKLTGKRVFVGDMTDVFGEWVPDELLCRLMQTMEKREDVVFQVLTKRAERLCGFMQSYVHRDGHDPQRVGEPPANIWLGVSCEDQKRMDERSWHLQWTPAAVRFYSIEPLIAPVSTVQLDRINWVIVGGESGPGCRPCHVDWIRSIVDQCKAASVPCFVKQLGGNQVASYYDDDLRVFYETERGIEWPDAIGWNHRDGQPPINSLVKYHVNSKGGNPDEWPRELRVREFPAAPVLQSGEGAAR